MTIDKCGSKQAQTQAARFMPSGVKMSTSAVASSGTLFFVWIRRGGDHAGRGLENAASCDGRLRSGCALARSPWSSHMRLQG